jgi:hypothetical protein
LYLVSLEANLIFNKILLLCKQRTNKWESKIFVPMHRKEFTSPTIFPSRVILLGLYFTQKIGIRFNIQYAKK